MGEETKQQVNRCMLLVGFETSISRTNYGTKDVTRLIGCTVWGGSMAFCGVT